MSESTSPTLGFPFPVELRTALDTLVVENLSPEKINSQTPSERSASFENFYNGINAQLDAFNFTDRHREAFGEEFMKMIIEVFPWSKARLEESFPGLKLKTLTPVQKLTREKEGFVASQVVARHLVTRMVKIPGDYKTGDKE